MAVYYSFLPKIGQLVYKSNENRMSRSKMLTKKRVPYVYSHVKHCFFVIEKYVNLYFLGLPLV